jgi:hypothetical protein
MEALPLSLALSSARLRELRYLPHGFLDPTLGDATLATAAPYRR